MRGYKNLSFWSRVPFLLPDCGSPSEKLKAQLEKKSRVVCGFFLLRDILTVLEVMKWVSSNMLRELNDEDAEDAEVHPGIPQSIFSRYVVPCIRGICRARNAE